MHIARTQAITHVGRSGRAVPEWLLVGDVVVRALLWLSLPLYLFPSLDPGSQIITASLIAGLGVAALGLVVVPACVTAWMACFTAAVCFALFLARKTVPFLHMLDILFTLGRRHLRRVHGRPLGIPAIEDQCRHGLGERERRLAAPGI